MCLEAFNFASYIDTFFISDSISDAEAFHAQLNTLHSSHQFTIEVRSGRALLFLDMLVKRREGSLITGVYQKTTFTDFYTKWNSFVPKSRKINLISTVVHRVLMKGSCKFDQEIVNIYDIFCDNGYPENVIKRTVERKIKCFTTPVVFSLSLSPVYLKLTWLGRDGQTQAPIPFFIFFLVLLTNISQINSNFSCGC